ncbi:MAG: hypothetical protein NW241_18325 [Bacteroidia bacterium]|nr:hypothetical protein [Bacteroidia bacterium]
MKTFKRILLIVGISLILIGGIAAGISLFGTYSTGSRVGNVTKFSHKGLLFKTWEGQLTMGGLGQGADGDLTANSWEFSVYPGDKEVIQAIDQAQSGGYKVKLHYKEKFFQFDWWGDTKYFIEKVEKVGS